MKHQPPSPEAMARIYQAMSDELPSEDARRFFREFVKVLEQGDPDQIEEFLHRTCEQEPDILSRSNLLGKKGAGVWFSLMHLIEQAYVAFHFDKVFPVTQSLKFVETEVCHPRIPAAFDGFQILWLSDFHLDVGHPYRTTKNICDVLHDKRPDILVLGGDYRHGHYPSLSRREEAIFSHLKTIREAIRPERTFAILGNHDVITMLPCLREAGAEPLVNEWKGITRGDASINIFGADDCYRFYQNGTRRALADGMKKDSFNIVLAHSPDLAPQAAAIGADLYLTGHTHGGQLRNPLLRYIQKRFFGMGERIQGTWTINNMLGFTSTGIGSSGIPIRDSNGVADGLRLRCQTLG